MGSPTFSAVFAERNRRCLSLTTLSRFGHPRAPYTHSARAPGRRLRPRALEEFARFDIENVAQSLEQFGRERSEGAALLCQTIRRRKRDPFAAFLGKAIGCPAPCVNQFGNTNANCHVR